jgi:hypothetical protein
MIAMKLHRAALLVATLAFSALGFISCSSEDCPNCPGGPATVRVSPGTSSVLPGRTLQLVALVLDADGNLLSGGDVSWSSSNEAFATVSATGLVTGVAAGAATITAQVGSLSGNGTLNVVTTSTFAGQVYPILKASCATAFCHVSPGPAPNMSTQAAAYTALSGATYTTAGDSTVGLLLGRMKNGAQPMPPGGAFATLERGNYDLIALWIQQGALNN